MWLYVNWRLSKFEFGSVDSPRGIRILGRSLLPWERTGVWEQTMEIILERRRECSLRVALAWRVSVETSKTCSRMGGGGWLRGYQ